MPTTKTASRITVRQKRVTTLSVFVATTLFVVSVTAATQPPTFTRTQPAVEADLTLVRPGRPDTVFRVALRSGESSCARVEESTAFVAGRKKVAGKTVFVPGTATTSGVMCAARQQILPGSNDSMVYVDIDLNALMSFEWVDAGQGLVQRPIKQAIKVSGTVRMGHSGATLIGPGGVKAIITPVKPPPKL